MSSPAVDPSSCTEVTCAESCTQNLPEVSFSLCNPEVNYGEIDAVFITNPGNPLTNENDPSEWATRMAASDDTKIIELHVIGDKPAPESSEIVISRNTTVIGSKTHTINVEIQQTNQINYDMLRAFECGKKILMWYRTAGGLLYGGAAGIEASMLLNEIIPKSRKELITFQGVIKWDNRFHPCRTTSVI